MVLLVRASVEVNRFHYFVVDLYHDELRRGPAVEKRTVLRLTFQGRVLTQLG